MLQSAYHSPYLKPAFFIVIIISLLATRFSASIRGVSIRSTLNLSLLRNMSSSESAQKGDVWFISHGGPPTMFDYESVGYKSWVKMGKYINRPGVKGIVIVSAHWESIVKDDVVVQINSKLDNQLVYDFYNFPKHYYEQKFHSRSTPDLRRAVQNALKAGGVGIKEEYRGLDHGVWPPLKTAFGETTDMPILQVSLPGDATAASAAKLGKALSAVRNDGYIVIGSGQVLHNLRDIFSGRPMPYAKPFLSATSAALSSPDSVGETINLTRHPSFKSAHPTPEHFLPLVVAAAAANQGDKLEEIAMVSDGMGWASWRWSAE